MKDTYKTITKACKGEVYKDRGSKFFGYAYPILSEEEVKPIIEKLKKEHYNARHWCYAYQIGTTKIKYRANDDGEPSNSAGPPIYGQIQAYDLTNILVVVVRYFGGTKLGVGGLINANKNGAKLVLDEANIIEKTIDRVFQITFEYKDMNKVMRIIKENNLIISSQKLELSCQYNLPVRKSEADKIFNLFDNTFGVDIKELEN